MSAQAPFLMGNGRWVCPICQEIAHKDRDRIVEHLERCAAERRAPSAAAVPGTRIQAEWEAYRAAFLASVPEAQLSGYRQAFFGAAAAMLALVLRLVDGTSEEEAAQIINECLAESDAFVATLETPSVNGGGQ